MALVYVVLVTALVVCAGLTATCLVCVDPRTFRRTRAEFGRGLRDVAPYLGVAALFFLTKRATHGLSVRLSRAIDWDITAELHAVEGGFVSHLQEVVPRGLLEFFSAMYMFGFPYLLVTAPILYFLLSSRRRLKELLVAYVLNYLVGAICYTLFIAYGPRVHLPAVDGLMYQVYPQTQELTAAISSSTDVFPSLHTSLAVVVMVFAWRSRREAPRWFPIASFVATGVVLSTMVLGIHWLLDVVAGVALGVWSVLAASRLVARVEGGADPAPSAEDGEERVASDVGD